MEIADFAYTKYTAEGTVDCAYYCDDVMDNFLYWNEFSETDQFCCEFANFEDETKTCSLFIPSSSFEPGDTIAHMDNTDESKFTTKVKYQSFTFWVSEVQGGFNYEIKSLQDVFNRSHNIW